MRTKAARLPKPPRRTLTSYTRRDGISDAGLAHFQAAYPIKGEGDTITNGRPLLLHLRPAALPRIPAVKRFADFAAFSKVGRDLAHWHLNYETVACYEGVTIEGSAGLRARISSLVYVRLFLHLHDTPVPRG